MNLCGSRLYLNQPILLLQPGVLLTLTYHTNEKYVCSPFSPLKHIIAGFSCSFDCVTIQAMESLNKMIDLKVGPHLLTSHMGC